MDAHTNVIIGIQARSTSKRFPNKIFAEVGGNTLLDNIIDSATKCARYMNRHTSSYDRNKPKIKVAVVVPQNDPASKVCAQRNNHVIFDDRKVSIIEGPEFDVLTRYKLLLEKHPSDYVVRVTADCPLLPSFFITKMITTAIHNCYDYCSNVDPRFRTSPDGFDVEVMSKRAMEWLFKNVTDPLHREHVTSALRDKGVPSEFRFGVILGYLDQSNLKISVDTPEDLRIVEEHFKRIQDKVELAQETYGKDCVHRF